MAERNEMMQQNQKQNIEQKYYYTVMEEQEGMRLDQFLAGELKEHSRSYIQKLIKEGRVTVGDKKEKPGCRLKVEDSVVICVPPVSYTHLDVYKRQGSWMAFLEKKHREIRRRTG